MSLLSYIRRSRSSKVGNAAQRLLGCGGYSTKVIGFVGLGSMGSQMVTNLRRDGKILHVFDTNTSAVENIVGDDVFPVVGYRNWCHSINCDVANVRNMFLSLQLPLSKEKPQRLLVCYQMML